MLPWFVQRPDLFGREVSDLNRAYPELALCRSALDAGWVLLHGALPQWGESGSERIAIAVSYPDGYPYAPPSLTPLVHGDAEEPHDLAGFLGPTNLRFFSTRHQMSDGKICLFELPGGSGAPRFVPGLEALRRAEQWIRAARRGRFPSGLDGAEADLEAHYKREGDILLGPAAFGDLPNQGRILAVKYRGPDGSPLYLATHVETTGGWQDDRKVLTPLVQGLAAGTDAPEWWDRAVLPEELEKAERDADYLVAGYFNLPTEPVAIRSINELVASLYPDAGDAAPERFLADFAIARLRAAAVVVALRFPARHGQDHEWLFLQVRLRAHALEGEFIGAVGATGYVLDLTQDRERLLRDGHITILKTHDLRRQSLELRNAGRVPLRAETLAVSVFGAGALGSQCVDLLAKAGIGRLSVWDPEVLEAGNVIRHTAELEAAGWPKALLVARGALRHNPYCDVEGHYGSALTASPQPSDRPDWAGDLCLSAIADDAVELAVNRTAVEARSTVYYLRGLRSGTTARMVRVRPGSDACLECLALYLRSGDPRALPVEASAGEVVRRECGRPVLAASAADLAIIAGLGVRRFLEDVAATASENNWVWTVSGIPGHGHLAEPFSSQADTLLPHPECQVCRRPPLDEIRLAPGVRERMLVLARQQSPRETGGILVGSQVGTVVEVVAVSDAGPEAESTATGFKRDGPHCQRFLEAVAKTANGTLDYVGEWHSHPGSSARPSPRDILSLGQIANDEDYLTECPIMIVVGFPRGADGEPQFQGSCYPSNGPGAVVPLAESDVSAESTNPKAIQPRAAHYDAEKTEVGRAGRP